MNFLRSKPSGRDFRLSRAQGCTLEVERLLRQDVFAQICDHDWSVRSGTAAFAR